MADQVLYHCEACDFTFVGGSGPTLCVRCGHPYVRRAAWPWSVKDPGDPGKLSRDLKDYEQAMYGRDVPDTE